VIQVRLTIRGVGASQTVLERAPDAPLFRLLHVGAWGQLTLEHLTLQGGEVSAVFFNRGGGILNESQDGPLIVQDAVIRQNAAWIGGGVHSQSGATMRLLRTAIEHNTADFVCGGVTASGETLIEDTLIRENLAESGGGFCFDPAGKVVVRLSIISGNIGFFNAGGGAEGNGDLQIVDVAFLDNDAGVRGGAFNLDAGRVRSRRVAIVGNTAANFGGGLSTIFGTVEASATTIAQNRVRLQGGTGGGVVNEAGTVRLRASVLAGNTAPEGPDCAGTVQVDRRTLVGDATGCDVQR
jgi:hypothetical protein